MRMIVASIGIVDVCPLHIRIQLGHSLTENRGGAINTQLSADYDAPDKGCQG
jgi:hypothetical protein